LFRIHGEDDFLALQRSAATDDTAHGEAAVLSFLQRHLVVSSPGADSADPKVTGRARNFVLYGAMDLPLRVVDASTCNRLDAKSYTRCYCRIRRDGARDRSATRTCHVCRPRAEQRAAAGRAAQNRRSHDKRFHEPCRAHGHALPTPSITLPLPPQ
jgi:hypothetical protein